MIFLAGILGSTILEYCMGVVMQKLFQARYWDYGRNRFHLNGHICPLCSLGWGLFSVAQIKILHPLIEPVMLKIPVNIASVISTILVAVYAADTALSVQSAQQMQEKPKNNKMCVIISEIAKRTKFAEDYAQQIMESKIKRCRLKGKQDKELSEKELKHRILEVNKRRAEYYSFIMGQSWGRKHNYDLCVNTTNTGACQVQKL